MSGFPPQFRAELRIAIDDCIELSSDGDCSTGPHGPIGEWDVSRVTDMRGVFYNSQSFNQSLSKWDVSRVTYMGAIFSGAQSFDQDLSKWDVSRVTDMYGMFYHSKSFNQDLSKWDVSRVTNMASMLNGAESFNQDISSSGQYWERQPYCRHPTGPQLWRIL